MHCRKGGNEVQCLEVNRGVGEEYIFQTTQGSTMYDEYNYAGSLGNSKIVQEPLR